MSYKYPNIVRSIYNDSQAHYEIQGKIETRLHQDVPLSNVPVARLTHICRSLDESVRQEYFKLSVDEIVELWDEILQKFGYPQPEDNPSKLSNLCKEIPMPSFSEPTTAPSKVTVETRHYVCGKDVTKMSDDELIHTIKILEKEIDELTNVKVTSKFIEQRIKETEETLAVVVKHLDDRATKKK